MWHTLIGENHNLKNLQTRIDEIYEKHQGTLTKSENRIIKGLIRTVKISKKINRNCIPHHIAFIMDGNGRWAQSRGLPRKFGHKVGSERMLTTLRRCVELGIQYVTFFAFSTENWNRPKDELDEMFGQARSTIERIVPELMELGVRMRTMGDITRFPDDLHNALLDIQAKTEHNNRCTLVLCANYGGRADIVQAVNKLEKPITENDITNALYCSDIPEPDLIVRTSGERRISNFLLWQMAYSELLFIKPHWPSMSPKLVDKCIIDFGKRKRRYGGI